MNKKTKMILGLGAIAVVGYLIWKKGQDKKDKGATTPPAASFVGITPTGKRHSFKGSNVAMRNRNK
jgi:uncharacterized membrane protein YebE (DUF533 family)